MFKAAGLPPPAEDGDGNTDGGGDDADGTGAAAAAAAAAADGGGHRCAICLDTSDSDCGLSANPCGHAYCDACWRTHLALQVDEGGATRLRCPALRCPVAVDDALVRRLLAGDAPRLQKYRRFLLEGFVSDNGAVAWCPSVPHCGHAVRLRDGDGGALSRQRVVACACGPVERSPHAPEH